MVMRRVCLALAVLGVFTGAHPGNLCSVRDGATDGDVLVVCKARNALFEDVSRICEDVLQAEDMAGFCALPSRPLEDVVEDSDAYYASGQGCTPNDPECTDRFIVQGSTLTPLTESAINTNAVVCHCVIAEKRQKRDAPMTIEPETSTNRRVTRKRLKEGITPPPGVSLAPGEFVVVNATSAGPGVTTQAPATTTKSAQKWMIDVFSLILVLIVLA